MSACVSGFLEKLAVASVSRPTKVHQSAYLGSLVRGVSVDAAGYGWESNTFQPLLLAEQQGILFTRYEAEQAI